MESLFGIGSNELYLPPKELQDLNNGIYSESDIKSGLINTNSLKSEGIERAILNKTVSTIMIPEELDIALPNYVIDITSVESLAEHQFEGIDALLNEEGDITLYMYTNGGLVKIGRGLSLILDRVLTICIAQLIGYECKVYKDFQINKPLNMVSEKDITTMRLSI